MHITLAANCLCICSDNLVMVVISIPFNVVAAYFIMYNVIRVLSNTFTIDSFH